MRRSRLEQDGSLEIVACSDGAENWIVHSLQDDLCDPGWVDCGTRLGHSDPSCQPKQLWQSSCNLAALECSPFFSVGYFQRWLTRLSKPWRSAMKHTSRFSTSLEQ